MSTTLLLAALDYEGDLTGSEKLVLIILCDRSNDGKGNYAWPSHQYISRKSCLSLATVKRACKSLKEKGFITWVKGKYVDGKFKTNHYRINHSSLRAVVKCNQVSKRAIERCHNDTHDSITVSDNNLNNNLNNNLEDINKFYEENINKISSADRVSAHSWTVNYRKENQLLEYDYVYKYLVVWIMSDQTQELWDGFKNGLLSPIEKGWTKGTS